MIQIIAYIYAGKHGLAGLREYESRAIAVLREHNGQLISASRSSKPSASDPDEIHVIQFPSMEDFTSYKEDTRLAALRELREESIDRIELVVTNEFYEYQ